MQLRLKKVVKILGGPIITKKTLEELGYKEEDTYILFVSKEGNILWNKTKERIEGNFKINNQKK